MAGSSTVEGVLIDGSLDQPVELLSREQVAAELARRQRRQRRQAMDAAYEAELILRLAELSPDDADPAPGSPGAAAGWSASAAEDPGGVSEFFAGELDVARAAALAEVLGTTGPQPAGVVEALLRPRPGGCRWPGCGPGRWSCC